MPALCASGRCSLQRTKRWTTNLCFATFFLAGGVEYSVIFPTMWDYMHLHFDSSEWLYGLSLAAFSISNLFTGPLFGAVFDRTHRTRLLVLFANLFEIGGELIWSELGKLPVCYREIRSDEAGGREGGREDGAGPSSNKPAQYLGVVDNIRGDLSKVVVKVQAMAV